MISSSDDEERPGERTVPRTEEGRQQKAMVEVSSGGARGDFDLTEGDEETDAERENAAVTLNGRSLRAEFRTEGLELEAGMEGWDEVMIQETWRKEQEEDEVREHRWLAS